MVMLGRIEVVHAVDGKQVEQVCRVIWNPLDDVDIVKSTVVIGRAQVILGEGRDRCARDALLVASTNSRTLGKRYAVLFESATGRLVALELDQGEETVH